MTNKCPKCNINLNEESYKNIKIRDGNILGLKALFGYVELNEDYRTKGYCNLCGASLTKIITSNL